MALTQLPAPELSTLSYGAATLQLLEGLCFSADGATLLVRVKYTDVADGGAALHYVVLLYDLASTRYTGSLNQLIAGPDGDAADIEVFSARVAGSGIDQIIVAEFGIKGSAEEHKLALIIGGQLRDADYLTTLLGPDINPRIERYALSNDGRFLAFQTDSAMLAPDSAPDTNDMSDIYLLDLQTQQVQRVSFVGGTEVFSPVFLGNVYCQDAQVVVAFSSAAGFVSADKNSTAQSEEAQTDAYLWRSAFDENGLTGLSQFQLLSARADGGAAGFVASDVPVLAGGELAYFSSTSPELVTNDANDVADTFFVGANGLVHRVELDGVGELTGGSTLLSVSESGRFVGLLTTTEEIAGAGGVQQAVVVDVLTKEWTLVSDSDEGILANDWVTKGVLAPDGKSMAFTSTADNIALQKSGALGGNLFLESTGFSDGVELDFLAYTWKTHLLLSGVVAQAHNAQTQTDVNGAANLRGMPANTTVVVEVQRAIPATETTATASAVNLQDAIAILKMIVGLEVNPPGQALSPYQALAADFNTDGAVGLADAIAVLRYVVGLSSVQPVWHLVDESSVAVAGITQNPTTPGFAPDVVVKTSQDAVSQHVGLVAYLSGDVNGSYGGPSGALDLDNTNPSYFESLVAASGISPAQFGIYL